MTGYMILLYHGVHDDNVDLGPRNRSGKHVSRHRFATEMKHLAENFPMVSMIDIANAHAGRGHLPDGAVAVTFDDGFLNNYTTAWEVLERFGVPASFYLATGFIGTGRMIWSDRLEATILGSAKSCLEIDAAGRKLRYKMDTESARIDTFLSVKALCKSLPDDVKDQIVDAVEQSLETNVDTDHPLYAFMNWDQVRDMNASRLISFGAHTVDHVSLARVGSKKMRQQIDDSVARLSAALGETPKLFSYPEGQEADISDDVISYLRDCGFDHCPTAIDGVNTVEATDPFWIRRIMVGFEDRAYPLADNLTY